MSTRSEAVKALMVSQESAGGQSMMTCSYWAWMASSWVLRRASQCRFPRPPKKAREPWGDGAAQGGRQGRKPDHHRQATGQARGRSPPPPRGAKVAGDAGSVPAEPAPGFLSAKRGMLTSTASRKPRVLGVAHSALSGGLPLRFQHAIEVFPVEPRPCGLPEPCPTPRPHRAAPREIRPYHPLPRLRRDKQRLQQDPAGLGASHPRNGLYLCSC